MTETTIEWVRSVQRRIARAVAARFVLHENLRDLRVPDRLARIVRQQILLGDVGNVFRFRILGEQMIKRLILVRPILLGDRQPPFLGIVEFRIDIEDHAPERKDPVTDDLSDLKFGGPSFYHISSNRPSLWPMLKANGRINLLRLPVRPAADPGPITMKKTHPHDRHSQPGVAVFRPDLHRLRLWQSKGLPEAGLAWMNFF